MKTSPSKSSSKGEIGDHKFGAPIFIVSPVKRAGTNYLKNILCRHDDCFSPGPIWEDELLRKAHLLSDYLDFTYQKWGPGWNVESELMSRQNALSLIGEGLIKMLHAQFSNSEEKRQRFSRKFSGPDAAPYRYVTKSPKSDNIALLPHLFPDAYLLILVRDGRAAVRSGQKSFSKPFDCAVREWSEGMDEIEAFINGPSFNPSRHMLLNYEQVASDPKGQMQKLMDYLDLNPEAIDLDTIDQMPVIGSSTLKSADDEVHWTPVEKPKDFDPLARAHELSTFSQSHFSYLAGSSGAFAGYNSKKPIPRYLPIHILRSLPWRLFWATWKMTLIAREELSRSLLRLLKGRANFDKKNGW